MKTVLSLFVISFGLLFNSCNIINPEEGSPSYVYIPELEFEGILTDSHNISEVWVFDSGTNLGVYDLPASVPILHDGPLNLTFRAGIKNNGVSSNRILYPFYTTYSEEVDLTPLEIDTVIPFFTIKDEVTIRFESVGEFNSSIATNYGETSNSLAILSVDNDDFFEGGGSGYLELTSEEFLWQSKSLADMSLPSGEFVFLELDYKSNNTFAVGLTANFGSSSEDELSVIVSPTTDDNGIPQWNKIYIDLGVPISSYPTAQSYNVLLESRLDADNVTGQIWFDNIKVIHFE